MERILGHAVSTKVSRVYDRAHWLRQQRKVLDAWGRKLTTITWRLLIQKPAASTCSTRSTYAQ